MTPVAGVILRAEMRAWRNRLLKAEPLRLAALVVLLLLGGMLFGGGALGAGIGLSAFVPAARGPALEGSFVGLGVLMLLFGFPTVISSYFAGRDLMQLVIAPIARSDIFVARTTTAISANLLVAGVLLAFVAGVGIGSRTGPVYYALALAMVAVQLVAVTAFQLLLMAAILRFVPARLARDVSVALVGVGGALVYLAWNLSVRQTLVPGHRPDPSKLISAVRGFEWVPTAWPGHTMGAVLAGDVGGTLGWTALTTVAALALAGAGALLYERTLLAGLGLLGGPSAGWRRTRRVERGPRGGISSPALAIAWKDFLSYRRDLKRISRVLPALIFLVAYTFVLARPTSGIDPFWNDVMIVTFASTLAALAIATPAIPSERRAYQLLRMAPITEGQVMAAKVLPILPLCLLPMAIAVALATTGRVGLAGTLGLSGLALWLAVGATAIGVSGGAIDPRFESTDDRRAVGVAGSLAAALGLIGFAICSVGAFALFRLGSDSLRGVVEFSFLPATPGTSLAATVIAVCLTAGAAAIVIGLFVVGRNRLRAVEGSIGSV